MINCLFVGLFIVLRLCFIIWLTAFRLVVRFCCWFGVYCWIVCSLFNSVVWFFLFWFYCFYCLFDWLILMFLCGIDCMLAWMVYVWCWSLVLLVYFGWCFVIGLCGLICFYCCEFVCFYCGCFAWTVCFSWLSFAKVVYSY